MKRVILSLCVGCIAFDAVSGLGMEEESCPTIEGVWISDKQKETLLIHPRTRGLLSVMGIQEGYASWKAMCSFTMNLEGCSAGFMCSGEGWNKDVGDVVFNSTIKFDASNRTIEEKWRWSNGVQHSEGETVFVRSQLAEENSQKQ